MITRDQTKGATAVAPTLKYKRNGQDRTVSGCKGMIFFPVYQKFRRLILSGGTYTAAELATMTGATLLQIPKYIREIQRRERVIVKSETGHGRTMYWYEGNLTHPQSIGEILQNQQKKGGRP